MSADLIGAVLAFLLGVAVAAGNYALSRHVLKTKPERYAMSMMARQFVQVLFIVLVFVLGEYTPWDRLWLLVGGVLGVTLPMFFFTMKLVKLNDSMKGKEETPNG